MQSGSRHTNTGNIGRKVEERCVESFQVVLQEEPTADMMLLIDESAFSSFFFASLLSSIICICRGNDIPDRISAGQDDRETSDRIARWEWPPSRLDPPRTCPTVSRGW
jgi:hypothetical protein